jgi:hypothetical protein
VLQARDWAQAHPEWKFLQNGKKWNTRFLKPGDVLEALVKTTFLQPTKPASRGQVKSPPKGLPFPPPPSQTRYTLGSESIINLSEEEMKAWLEENARWKIARNEEFWNYQDMEPGDNFHLWENKLKEREVVCKYPDMTVTVKKNQARVWLFNHIKMNIKRNNMPWDGQMVETGDKFEALGKRLAGAGPKKYRDPFSVKNFNARMARRKKIEASARDLREKRQAEDALEESICQRSTSVIYEGEEFITRSFVDDKCNKSTARRFGRWIRSFSGLERPWQNLFDESTGKEFTGIQGKTLDLLNPDEVLKTVRSCSKGSRSKR